MSSGLDRDDIRALLDDLSAELAARGARAELFLVRGAKGLAEDRLNDAVKGFLPGPDRTRSVSTQAIR